MTDTLQNYARRTRRYDNIDGTGEMYMGIMVLAFVLLGYLQAILPENSMWRYRFASLVFAYAVLLPVLAFGYWGVRRTIKKYITWPRTGYVAYGHCGKSWWSNIAALVIALVVVVVCANVERLARHFHAMSLGRAVWMAFNVAAYAFWILFKSKEHPWKRLIVVLMALGLFAIAFIVPRGDFDSRRPEMLFIALTWLASGVATLYSYIRHTQPPAPESE
jgi:glucan phosphoethanolaminetransferase (alkaline phosphatase superfamily)